MTLLPSPDFHARNHIGAHKGPSSHALAQVRFSLWLLRHRSTRRELSALVFHRCPMKERCGENRTQCSNTRGAHSAEVFQIYPGFTTVQYLFIKMVDPSLALSLYPSPDHLVCREKVLLSNVIMLVIDYPSPPGWILPGLPAERGTEVGLNRGVS